MATSNIGARGCVWNRGMASKISILVSPSSSLSLLLSDVVPTSMPHTEANAYLCAWRIVLIYAAEDIWYVTCCLTVNY